ncbi:hypothetical protein BN2497_4471 [Janthinobacterium sp. CG23_2]|nr:hypothetical protein BN2497_4471 [Janthinobacterium sp. CG23_2]CUU28633.1 hypothetical protein BN3177_4471 [Janthinobacterium sp. CG23_2]
MIVIELNALICPNHRGHAEIAPIMFLPLPIPILVSAAPLSFPRQRGVGGNPSPLRSQRLSAELGSPPSAALARGRLYL